MADSHFKQRVIDRLNSDHMMRVDDSVGKSEMQATYHALMKMPNPQLEKFLESDTVLVVGQREFCNQQARLKRNNRLNGFFLAGRRIDSRLIPLRKRNYDPNMVAVVNNGNPRRMERTLLHEIGHDMDFDRSQRRYRSLSDPLYRSAVDDYMNQRKIEQEKTRVFFPFERSFAKEHGRMEGYNNNPNAVYKEFSAEMFSKYILRADAIKRRAKTENAGAAFVKADRVMLEDYGQAWSAYKQGVCPELNEFIQAERQKLEPKQKLAVKMHASFTKATNRSFFNRLQAIGVRLIKAMGTHLKSKTEITSLPWEKEQAGPARHIYAVATTNMSQQQVDSLREDLTAKGIDTSISKRNKNGKPETGIVVHDPTSVAKFEELMRKNHKKPSKKTDANYHVSAAHTSPI